MNIMVDIETMGTAPGSAILAIGAVKFDGTGVSDTGFYRSISLDSCMRAGLTLDASTIEWWMRQSEQARSALLTDKIELNTALTDFVTWADIADGKQTLLWGNGANFDTVLLRVAAERAVVTWPFPYYNDRCFRTLRQFASAKALEKTSLVTNLDAHNAFSDAVYQARIASILLADMEEQI